MLAGTRLAIQDLPPRKGMKQMPKLRLSGLLFSTALLVWGQADANKAQLAGTVLDPRGAVIAGASVKIKNMGNGLLRDLTTNPQGEFRAVQLDPGKYEVVAQSSGFAATTLPDVVLNVGAAVSINITLQLQATTQTVEVAATMLNSDLPAPSTVLTTTAISNLPINGRRFQDLALLTPQVVVEPSRSQISF